ncbi:acylphosphatase [Candidatus Micrarchaeota archaeon]|nr:acylphosphatase [Candidatus Micrarchaeota archaeon]
MKILKIVFQGHTPEHVQGVNLRESIQELAENGDFSVKGQVRNLKHDGHVELLLEGDLDRNQAFLDAIRELLPELVDLKSVVVKQPVLEDRELSFNSQRRIEVVREDDATETVWALKGAGRQFARIGKNLKKFAERDQRKKRALIRAFQTELSNNLQILQHDPKNKKLVGRIRLTGVACHALLNNLEAFEEKDMPLVQAISEMAHLVTVYNSCVDALILTSSTPNYADVETEIIFELPGKIKALLDELSPPNGLKKRDS